MNHYTYLLTFPDGMKYIGCRSTKLEPELDTLYLGSGSRLPERSTETCTKTILETFKSRKEAVMAEIRYIDEHNCLKSSEYYNIRRRTYDRHGDEGPSTNVGRSAETHEYIRKANKKRRAYQGANRTDAQKAADAKKLGKSLGPNPAKACKGVRNGGFTPWYYITPEGVYQEVYDRTKQEMAPELGFTTRQMSNRFSPENRHKAGRYRPFTGWVFGNLPKPDELESNEL